MTSSRILIVGGSTRAAADSTRRAGWNPVCADLFADLDLRQHAEVISVKTYPHSLPDDLKDVYADGWFYCGAIENFPSIVHQIQSNCPQCGPLLGTPTKALRLTRDPQWLSELLASRGLPGLDVRSEFNPPPPDGSWLQKPLASAGGRSIRVWNDVSSRTPLNEPHYFQRRVEGVGISASVAVSESGVEWLGITKELPNFHQFSAPSDFAYCGSFGPIVDDKLEKQMGAIANAIIEQASGLRGIVGFDFRFDGQIAWLTEVNPRYTASIELLELATGRSALTGQQMNEPTNGSIAKRILYATKPFTAPDLTELLHNGNAWKVPQYTDIPVPGTSIEAGWPICSVFATGSSEAALQRQLSDRIQTIRMALETNLVGDH